MQDDGQWDECPDGVLRGMADELRRRRRSQQLRPVIAAGLLLLVVCAVGYGVIGGGDTPTTKALTCSETVPLLADYHDQRLADSLAEDVQEHLADCPMCREHYEEMYPNEVRNDVVAASQLVAVSLVFEP